MPGEGLEHMGERGRIQGGGGLLTIEHKAEVAEDKGEREE